MGNLAGTGQVFVHGSTDAAPPQATLEVLSAAPATLSGNTTLDGNALLEYASGQVGTIASSVTLTLNGPKARLADAADTTGNTALAGLTEIDGQLQVINGNTVATTGNLAVTGTLNVDGDGYSSEGGSAVTVAGTLTNTGTVGLGPFTGGLSAPVTLTVGNLAGTGRVFVHGSTGAASPQATLDVLSAAPATLVASTTIDGNGLLEYATGQVGTIGSGVTLTLNGPKARLADAADTTGNSALAGLAEIAGQLQVINGDTVATTGNLAVTGTLDVDGDGYSSEGGSTVTIAGTLANTGSVTLGPFTGGLSAPVTLTVGGLAGTGTVNVHGGTGATPTLATLSVLSAAPTTLSGNTTLDGNGLLEYASGQVGTIASGVTLTLNGPKARLADAADTTGNSALAGLTKIDGQLQVVNGDSVVTTGNLAVTGTLDVDGDGYSSEGGSAVTVAGTLTNTGAVTLGPFTGGLSAPVTLTVGNLAGTGTVNVHGGTAATPSLATLHVLSAAPATLIANTTLDGNALLEYASGQIGTIATNVTLSLSGPNARVADAADTTGNSALASLAEIDGALRVIDGDTVAVTGALAVVGTLDLDGDGFTAEGGSTLTIGGTVTNTGTVTVGPSTGGLSAATTLSVGKLAGAGAVNVHGSTAAAPPLATLDVLSAAPAKLIGNTTLDGNALLEFASGQIGTIGSNVTLQLNGGKARVADAGAPAGNTALMGLTEIDGTVRIINGDTLAITGDLAVTGALDIDGDYDSSEGGSAVTIGGTLTNSGTVSLGPGSLTLTAPATLSVSSLGNTGTMSVFGSATYAGTLRVTNGAASSNTLTIGHDAVLGVGGTLAVTGGTTSVSGQVNASAVNVTGGTLTVAGGTVTVGSMSLGPTTALSGNGTVRSSIANAGVVTASGGTLTVTGTILGGGSLAIASGATLELGAATAETVALAGNGDTLQLDAPTTFNGEISGLTLGDTIALKNEAVTAASAAFIASSGTSTLTLTLAGGATQAYTLAGNYAGDVFSAVQSGADSLISVVVPAIAVINTPQPIQFGQLHAGAVASRTLSIGNAAGAGAPGLDASVASATGGATATGSIKHLTQGATDTTGITVGLNTVTGGALNGTVTLAFASDVSGNPSPLPNQAVSVLGTVYREAAARFAPATAYLHVGDPATQALVVSNADPADGFSESLTVRVMGFSGGLTAASGLTGPIAAGASDASSLSITLPTKTTAQVNGIVTANLQSVATGGDTLGTTDLGTVAIPVTVYVDNNAEAAFGGASSGTLTKNGTDFTLDLGTVAANSGADTVGFGVFNTAAGPADQLSGSFSSSGSAGFTLAGLAAFGGVGAGAADMAPTVTLDTTQAGPQMATITLTPTGSNPSGFSLALPAETLTVKANVVALLPPVIAGAAPLTGTAAIAENVGPLTVTDPNALTEPLTVTVSDASGVLAANASGTGTVSNSGTNRLTLTGTAAQIDAELASLTYLAPTAGSDTITLAAADQFHANATRTIAVTTKPVPLTGVVINSPVSITALVGASSGLGGLSITDPIATATGATITLNLTTAIGTLAVKNPPDGATVTGNGTAAISLTGTVAQINASLADDGILTLGTSLALVEYLERVSKNVLNTAAVNAINGSVTNNPITPDELVGAIVAGPEAKSFSLGVALSSFALNSISLYATTGAGPSAQAVAAFLFGVFLIATDAHLVEPDGTILDFNPAGEFVFATSNQGGDSFDVQVRVQPLGNSQSASIVTAAAAQLGNDRVTFAVGRPGVVWVNGAAVNLALNAPDLLSGGELTQVDAQTYKLVWNTGEVLTVTDSGTFLSLSASAGPNATPGSIVGLATLSAATTAGNDLALPDGTVLSGPITSAQLAQFANAWRVPQQFSLLDYAPGQSTATFTDTSFPKVPITLANLPASIVAAAAAVVAAAGITDPGVAAAAEFDYIASGGDLTFVQADAQLLSGRTTTPETITPSGAPPASIGVVADKARVMGDGTNPVPVVFDLYLTAPAATDTVVNYAVLGNSGDIGAAAFGRLPSGSVTITAGQTVAQVTVNVPEAALGALPQGRLELGISSPAGVPLFTSSAQATVAQPIAGPPPVPVFSSLTRLGTFTEVNSTAYTLDLGDIQYGEPLPDILFGLTNAGSSVADTLGGTFAVAPVDGFTVTGAALPSALSGGQAYDGLDLAVNFTKFGPNAETITYTPTDTNNSGFASALPPITLTVTDDIVAPSMVFSQAWGDVHIVTYNGLKYDFQEVGEFTLAKSRITGDSFDIQLRLQPWFTNATVSVITQVAVSVGTDRVTFDSTRPDVIEVDGVASTLSAGTPVIALNGGSLSYISGNVFQVNWTTGEEATVTDVGKYLNVSDGIPLSLPNSVGGLQGEDAGQANDFQLPDGTVLPQPLTYDQLHQEFADGWRVSPAASLFDYPAGEGTANFTDRGFPADVVPLSSLPAGMVSAAAALVAAAGITDPGLAQSAEQDYLATGDTSFIGSTAAVQQQITATTIFTPTDIPAPAALAGVTAPAALVTEAASGSTAVTFQVFLTAAQGTDTAVNYTVVDGGTGTLGAAAFGGTLPSGTVTVPAGQTTATLAITVPPNALGAHPVETLQVQLLPTGRTQIYKSTAMATVTNPAPQPGTPAQPILTDLSHPGALVATSPTAYTLNLGALSQGQAVVAEQLAVQNAASASADQLGGSFGAPLGSGFTVVGNALRNAPLSGGQSYSGLYVSAATTSLASNTETLVFKPVDSNASGYSQALPAITLTIEDSVTAPASAGLNSPASILFPNAHVGAVEQQALSVTNTAAAPAASLDVTAVAGGSGTVSGSITRLPPGSTDASSLVAALDTSATGMRQAVVALQAASDGGGGSTKALAGTPTVDLFGTVYRLASATAAAVTRTLHVGDPGTAQLVVRNSAAADGYSENLIATVASDTGGVGIGTAGPTADIAPGQSDTGTLAVTYSTVQAATITGTAVLGLVSDGTAAIDGLGRTALASLVVPVSITVDNYAQAAFEVLAGGGTLTRNGNGTTLALGAVASGSAPIILDLGVVNSAAGPADLLAGSFAITGSAQFTNAGFAPVSNLAAGQDERSQVVTLSTGQVGSFSETITLNPVGSNASAYSGALPAQTLTITGTVTARPVTNPVVSSPSLTVAENATATPIGIAAPSESGIPPVQIATTLTTLPTNGTVTLADGVTAVTAGEALTTSQLTGLEFTPVPGTFGTNSTLSYTVSDGAGGSSVGTATLAIGPAVGAPTVSSPSLTVQPGAAATTIGIGGPADPNYPASALTVTAATLPADGTVTLADGTTPVTAGETLTPAQLTGLAFTPARGLSGTSSTFGYTVSDPAGNAATGAATLAIAASAAPVGTVTTASTSLLVAPGAVATPIGLAAPIDTAFAGGQLSVTVTGLPDDGVVDLADGVTAVTAGEVLTGAQLAGLTFTPQAGRASATSALTYAVRDPSGSTGTGTATLAIGPAVAVPAPTAVLAPPAGGATATKAITNTPQPIVSGSAAAGAAVTLSTAGVQVGSTAADPGNGAYSTTLTGSLPLGNSQVTATASTAAGATSAPVLSVYEIPSPVAGVSLPDIGSIDIGHLFDAGYQLQFVAGTEAAQLVDGVLSVGPDTAEATIQRLYEGLLGRSNDVSGMTFYDNLLATGSTATTVAADILASPEYVALQGAPGAMTDTQYVASLYGSLLGRPPTDSDTAFWTAGVASVGRAAIAGSIAGSPEAANHLAPDTAEVWSRNTGGTLIHDLYETGLDREVELGPFGLGFWQTLLLSGLPPDQLAQQILSRPEPQALHAGQDDTAFVTSLYQDGLGRVPDKGGLTTYVNALQAGSATRAGVLLAIATSPEAAVHLIRDLPSY